MSKVKIVSIIYAIGIIIGALFFDVWGADTTPFKTLSVFAWKIKYVTEGSYEVIIAMYSGKCVSES